jgi:predicted DNA-binding antitoxin AbrB/MazE fold protein
MAAIRAIYRNGQLQLLDPVTLVEGQEVQLQIIQPETGLQELVGDMLVHFEADESQIDEESILAQIAKAMNGKRPLSEIIIEERYATNRTR